MIKKERSKIGFFRNLPFVLCAILAIPGAGHAQDTRPSSSPTPEPAETEQVLRVSSDLVMVPVSVMDREGRYATNL